LRTSCPPANLAGLLREASELLSDLTEARGR
jgi:hypothetical protein